MRRGGPTSTAAAVAVMSAAAALGVGGPVASGAERPAAPHAATVADVVRGCGAIRPDRRYGD